MASATSMGLHNPTAITYIVKEGVISADPAPEQYAWVTTPAASQTHGDEELLVTTSCVVWSRGGVVRRVFRFEVEGQPVVQATFAWFPTHEEHERFDALDEGAVREATSSGKPSKAKADREPRRSSGWSFRAQSYSSELYARNPRSFEETRRATKGYISSAQTNLSRALVVVLRTQAHIYFLSGSSHVVHLPFEVDSVHATLQGVIIRRKYIPPSPPFQAPLPPSAPPNSFISSFGQSWSMPTIRNSLQGMDLNVSGRPVGTPRLGRYATPSALIEGADKNMPTLYYLSDPLMELGLVLRQHPPKDSVGTGNSMVDDVALFPSIDMLLYVSPRSSLSHSEARVLEESSIALALTFDYEADMYTVWTVFHTKSATSVPRSKAVMATGPRAQLKRRSSFGAASGTGTSTPIPYAGNGTRESLGAAGRIQTAMGPPKLNASFNLTQEEKWVNEKDQLASSLDIDINTGSTPTKGSRRVSSLLARADLASSQNPPPFPDLKIGNIAPTTSGRRSDHYGTIHGRSSFIENLGSSFRAASLATGHIASSITDGFYSTNEPTDGPANLDGISSTAALKDVILMRKIETFSAQSARPGEKNKVSLTDQKVFILEPPQNFISDKNSSIVPVIMCVVERRERRLLVLTLNIERLPDKVSSQRWKRKLPIDHSQIQGTTVKLVGISQSTGVHDVLKLMDGNVSRILVLSENSNKQSMLTLRSPWCNLFKITLPKTLRLFEHDLLGLPSHLRKVTKAEFSADRRTVSQQLVGLEHGASRGLVTMVDGEGSRHRLQIQMRPRCEHVAKALDVCRWVLPGSQRGGEGVLVAWWEVLRWLRERSEPVIDEEWTALNITLMTMAVGFLENPATQSRLKTSKRSTRSSRSSLGTNSDMPSWNEMLNQVTSNGSPDPYWIRRPGWDWCVEEETREGRPLRANESDIRAASVSSEAPASGGSPLASIWTKRNSALVENVKLAHEFRSSAAGSLAMGERGYLPTAKGRDPEIQRTAIPTILVGLHLYREELKLDTTSSDSEMTGVGRLAPILAQLGGWLGWDSWSWRETGYYSTEDASMARWHFDDGTIIGIDIPPQPFEPPSIYDWVEKSLKGSLQAPFLTLGDIVDISPRAYELKREPAVWNNEDYWRVLTPRTPTIIALFTRIAKASGSPVSIIQDMVDLGLDNAFVETLPEGIGLPLSEAIATCRSNPPTTWKEEALKLVGRDDLSLLLNASQEKRELSKPHSGSSHEAVRDVHSICNSALDTEAVGSSDGVAELDRQAITRLIFREDRRFQEASKLVQSAKPSVARCFPEPDWSESDLLEAQKDLVQTVAIRTLSVTAGRGLLYFSARVPLLTERFPISGFNLSCVMKPMNNTVSADKSAFTEEKVGWAFFHAGVAAGLSISRAAKGIDTSWIMFNKPTELSNRHAGFLLALGLNGHLKSIAKWMAFKYLTPKHTMTSIGLLLGLSASYLGTMDPLVTRLLSVHVTCMLPPGAAELNLSPLTQTAGLVASGLLYCGTQHRRMSELMLSEVEHISYDDVSVPLDPLRDEGYRFAAGFALGLINLGKGQDLRGLHDMHLVERLLTLAVGTKRVNIVHVLDKSMAAATIAIALIFMKTHDGPLARKIDIPDTLLQYDYVRPDIFLLRTVAKHLIMWDNIKPTYVWFKMNLPAEFRENMKLKTFHSLNSEDLAFYNIIAGLCLCIGLRFAGSGAIEVRDILGFYLDHFIRLCRLPAISYDQKLTRSTVRNCQDVIALSAATVMAGTGDLQIFRRLRSLHGRTDSDTPYGSHLAAHMGIGILFLGGGSYTLGTSNLAVAALLCSFYPLFPKSILDNSAHLQAFRHLCVLAAEPRCIVPRDADTGRPVSVPIHITLRDGSERKATAPCLLPALDTVTTVSTTSAEHWRVVLDFASNPTHVASFEKNQSIYVRERAAYYSTSSVFHATIQALNDAETTQHPLEWLLGLPTFANLDKPERALVLQSDAGSPVHASTETTLVDTRLILERACQKYDRADQLRNLRLLFAWADRIEGEGGRLRWVKREFVDRLRASIWMALMDVA